jgi:hypothetical protein
MLRLVLIAVAVALAGAPGSAVAGPEESDFVFAPPPWYYEGRALLIERGGTCEQSTQTYEQGEGIPFFPKGGERVNARSEHCEARIPVEVMKAFGGNPTDRSMSARRALSTRSASPYRRRRPPPSRRTTRVRWRPTPARTRHRTRRRGGATARNTGHATASSATTSAGERSRVRCSQRRRSRP